MKTITLLLIGAAMLLTACDNGPQHVFIDATAERPLTVVYARVSFDHAKHGKYEYWINDGASWIRNV